MRLTLRIGVTAPADTYYVTNVFCTRHRFVTGSAHSETMAAIAQVPHNVLERIALGDHSIMRTMNSWRAPRWIRLWMICATRGGDGWLWYAIGLAVALFGGEHRLQALAASSAAVGIGIGIFIYLKGLFRRKRPCALEPHCWATLLPRDQFSFPSGHSITAFSVAISLGQFYPSLLPVLLFFATSIALSRVVLSMHFLSDVIAGAAIGALVGHLAYTLIF